MDSSAAAGDAITSSEQFLEANGLRLAYETFGSPRDPVIVLIMGLGTQMISWPDAFCGGLAECGYRVIRFDNRDIGLSEKLPVDEAISIPRLLFRYRLGLKLHVPYTLEDMANDTIGVLDALEIPSAHLVGASMGGMIAQLATVHYPERVRSLTSIMSTTGNPRLPGTRWRAARQMLMRPKSTNENDLVEHGLKTWAIIGSPDFRPPEQELRARLLRSIRRCHYPRGYRHQLAAIIENGDRSELLSTITRPTLVIHGKEDVLIPAEGGVDTANRIPGATLKLIEGMGHDLPAEIQPRLIRYIDRHIRAIN